MNCLFIYNPVGGNGKISKKKDYIVSELKQKYDEVDVYATQCAGDMTRAAREAVGKYDILVFAGGDGSFNEVLQGIADFDELPILGYIPSGTTNDMAHTLKIPSNIKKALDVIKNGEVQTIDCMKANDRYAIYVVTAGAFTSATYNAPQIQKKHIGRIAYGLEGIKHNLKFQEFFINCSTHDGEVESEGCVFIAFMNSKYVAGFKMNKKADVQDGKIEAVIIHRSGKRNVFKKLASYFALAGLFLFGYHSRLRNTTRMEGQAFDICIDEGVMWNLDGEKGFPGNVHVEVVPNKLKIMLPIKNKEKRR